jgi:hypothetical protein
VELQLYTKALNKLLIVGTQNTFAAVPRRSLKLLSNATNLYVPNYPKMEDVDQNSTTQFVHTVNAQNGTGVETVKTAKEPNLAEKDHTVLNLTILQNMPVVQLKKLLKSSNAKKISN